MFSFFSISNVKKFLVVGFVLFAAFMFGSCDDKGDIDDTNYPGTLPAGLVGTWEFAGEYGTDKYEITSTTLDYPADYGMDFKGTIEFVSNYSNDSGVIIIKKTEGGDYNASKPYFGIYYQNLTAVTVQLANSWDSSVPGDGGYGEAPDTATLNEAIAKFTLGKAGNFVDWGYVNPYTKK